MDLNRFIIDLIRKKNYRWLEERRIEFVPLLSDFLNNILDAKSVLIVTDEKRKWYGEYLLNKFNNFNEFKPQFFPFYLLENLVPQISFAKHSEDFDMIEDMLNVSFNDYIFWYIGQETPLLKFARRKPDSFYWIMDNDVAKNFYLKSVDPFLDNKLIQLADVVNESLNAAVFSEVEI